MATFSANRAFLARLTVWTASAWAGFALAGCDRPCHELADQLCARVGTDDHACELWRSRTTRVSAETCSTALRAYNRERTR